MEIDCDPIGYLGRDGTGTSYDDPSSFSMAAAVNACFAFVVATVNNTWRVRIKWGLL
jgi:hypothetical protein